MLPQTGALADSTGDELAAYLAETTRRVDAEIARAMDDVVPERWMLGAIGYHLGWTDDRFALLPPAERVSGGKRLRPALMRENPYLMMLERLTDLLISRIR